MLLPMRIGFAEPIDKDSISLLPGTILFVSNRTGKFQIYTMKTNGTSIKRLTIDKDKDSGARWSPDGKKIVFVKNDQQIWLMDNNGANREFVYNGTSAAFSPDGKKLVFSKFGGDIYTGDDLYIYEISTKKVSNFAASIGSDYHPNWSAKLGKVVFTNYFYLYNCYFKNICVVNANGTKKTQLTDYDEYSSAFPDGPRWSPDGTKILYANHGSNQKDSLYTMSPTGAKNKCVAHSTGHDINSGVWSPDGKYFLCSMDGKYIYRLKLDLSEQNVLTSTASNYPMDWR